MSPRPDPNPAARVGRAPGALWRAGRFGVVVLPERSAEPLTLAGTGAQLWEALATPQRPEDLAGTLAAAFAADPEVVAHDLDPVLGRLVAAGALEWTR
jgi:hypothetical protein